MDLMKQTRQRAIRDLVETRSIRTQQELAAQLHGRGFRTTQATISRDVRELGLAKHGRGGTSIYVLPQDEAFLNQQFIRSGRCDGNGRFEIDSLRPGSYYAFAFDRVDGAALSDPAFVRGLAPLAETFQVKQGETASVRLKVTPWPE